MKTSFLKHQIAVSLSLVVVIIVIVLGVFLYLYKVSPPKQTTGLTNPLNQTQLSQETQNISPNPQPKIVSGSQLTSLNTLWNRFTSDTLGIRIDVPKLASAGCSSDTIDRKNYPVHVIEDRDDIIIANSIATQIIDLGCSNLALSEADIKNSARQGGFPNLVYSSWKIKVRKVQNEAEIDSYIKDTYGSGCSMGRKTESKQKGVYDVEIIGDGKSLDETLCPINIGIVLKYSEEKQKIANWNLGQDITFYDGKETVYDTQMLDSFLFN